MSFCQSTCLLLLFCLFMLIVSTDSCSGPWRLFAVSWNVRGMLSQTLYFLLPQSFFGPYEVAFLFIGRLSIVRFLSPFWVFVDYRCFMWFNGRSILTATCSHFVYSSIFLVYSQSLFVLIIFPFRIAVFNLSHYRLRSVSYF